MTLGSERTVILTRRNIGEEREGSTSMGGAERPTSKRETIPGHRAGQVLIITLAEMKPIFD